MKHFNFDLQLFATSQIADNAALVQTGWARKLWRSSQDELWWEKFIGVGPQFIIDKNTDLKKAAGDAVAIPLFAKLIGPPITGDNTARGNEEPMAPMSFSVPVNQYRKAVELLGKMDEQKTQLDLRTNAHALLTTWMAEELIDQSIFNAMSTTPSPNRVIMGNNRTAVNLIQTGDTMSCTMISQAKRKATLAGTSKNVTITSGTTATTTAGTYTVTGGGSAAFNTDILPGDLITVGAQSNYVVSVQSATALTCAAQWLTAVSGATPTVVRWLGAEPRSGC